MSTVAPSLPARRKSSFDLRKALLLLKRGGLFSAHIPMKIKTAFTALFAVMLSSCVNTTPAWMKSSQERQKEIDAASERVKDKAEKQQELVKTVLNDLLLALMLSFCLVFNVACQSKPSNETTTHLGPDGKPIAVVNKTDLGWTFMKKSSTDLQAFVSGDTKLVSLVQDGDETVVPGKVIDGYTQGQVIKGGVELVKEGWKGQRRLKEAKDPSAPIPLNPNIQAEANAEATVIGAKAAAAAGE